MKNIENIFRSLVKICVAIMLILPIVADFEYSYYTLLRWVVCGCSVYFAYTSYIKKRIGLLIFFIACGLLFNPFIKVWLQKSTWHVVDLIVAAIVLLSIVLEFTTSKIQP